MGSQSMSMPSVSNQMQGASPEKLAKFRANLDSSNSPWASIQKDMMAGNFNPYIRNSMQPTMPSAIGQMQSASQPELDKFRQNANPRTRQMMQDLSSINQKFPTPISPFATPSSTAQFSPQALSQGLQQQQARQNMMQGMGNTPPQGQMPMNALQPAQGQIPMSMQRQPQGGMAGRNISAGPMGRRPRF